MAFATTDDGVRLYHEETGSGSPIIFVHEFAGDHRSWERQLQYFGRRYRAITYAARGYPPSDVPEDPASYSQNRAADDILAVLDHLGIQKAHVCGLSTLHFGFRHPSRALSLCVAGCGYGAELDMREQFRAEADAVVASLRADGMAAFASRYAHGPTRVQFEARTRAVLRSSKRLWPSIQPWVPPTPSSAAKRSVRRCIICKTRWLALRCRR
jgi:pimeloyl-ACP methyl ester carboxylesterase